MNRLENADDTHPAHSEFEEEKKELEIVLANVLPRSSNAKRLLLYICEKHFDGKDADIKEYGIAVDAFGRAPDFDPTVDSIVRVEAHRLRNKLSQYYDSEGSLDPIHISLPTGGYVPQFKRVKSRLALPAKKMAIVPLNVDESGTPALSPLAISISPSSVSTEPQIRPKTKLVAIAVTVALLTALAGIWIWSRTRQAVENTAAPRPQVKPSLASTSKEAAPSMPGAVDGVRIMSGATPLSEADFGDAKWVGDRYFKGGEAATLAEQKIADYSIAPSLYIRRRRGNFKYAIPLKQGMYELRLHFADAFFGRGNANEGGESSRLFDVKANGTPLLTDFDVIADAGGANTADIKVFPGIQPDIDGFLHLDFIPRRNVAFVNGIELVATDSNKQLPIRIYTGTTGFKDRDGEVWDSDRYFRGGVHRHHIYTGSKLGEEDERFGNFSYQIPVAQNRRYTAKLKFCRVNDTPVSQAVEDGNVFNVLLNGRTLLDNFSIGRASGSANCTVKTFRDLIPTAQNKLTLSFIPTHGYASVNAIEVKEQ